MKESTFGDRSTRWEGIFARSSPMGVKGAVVSAITSTTLQYEEPRFLAINAMSSDTWNLLKKVIFGLSLSFLTTTDVCTYFHEKKNNKFLQEATQLSKEYISYIHNTEETP